jgi:ribulose-phosphate 3-epimerase
MTTILPALIAADPLALGDAIAQVESARAEMLHVDLMDGVFVSESSFGTRATREIRRRTSMTLEVHLQVERPENYLSAMLESRVDLVTFHIESTRHSVLLLREIESAGLKGGIALNPGTPLNSLDEILGSVHHVVVMTSNPGTSDFLDFTVGKIARLRALLDDRGLREVRIAADGGVTVERVAALARAGADRLVAGSAVFKAEGGAAAGIEALLRAADPRDDDPRSGSHHV